MRLRAENTIRDSVKPAAKPAPAKAAEPEESSGSGLFFSHPLLRIWISEGPCTLHKNVDKLHRSLLHTECIAKTQLFQLMLPTD